MLKRIFAILMAMMCCGSAFAEAFITPEMPVFTEAYGLEAFYALLEAKWGAFYMWPIEAKAWLHNEAEALDLAQLAWLESSEAEADHTVDWWLPSEALDRMHGIPGPKAMPQAEAVNLARTMLGEGVLNASFLLDDPVRPVWAIGRYEKDKLLTEVCIDAWSGTAAASDGVKVREAARTFLVAEEAALGQHAITADWLAVWEVTAAYLPSQGAWRVTFTAPERKAQVYVTVEDGTLALVDMQFFNG